MAIILASVFASISGEAVKKLREAGPEERKNIAQKMAEVLDLSTQFLRESPELRDAFARVHSEFLNYPECVDTIRVALNHEKFLSREV